VSHELPMIFVDRAISRVRKAVALAGKKPLAARADVAHGVLRHVESTDFSPTAGTLRKLENASIAILAEHREARRVAQGEPAA
jgi:hypothetical protein